MGISDITFVSWVLLFFLPFLIITIINIIIMFIIIIIFCFNYYVIFISSHLPFCSSSPPLWGQDEVVWESSNVVLCCPAGIKPQHLSSLQRKFRTHKCFVLQGLAHKTTFWQAVTLLMPMEVLTLWVTLVRIVWIIVNYGSSALFIYSPVWAIFK